MNLSNNLKKHFRLFIYYYTNGTLPFLVGDILNIPVDYREELMYEATSVVNIFTIYMNNIKMDENGKKTPTYLSRWHYTSDRLLHHDRTVDITSSVAHENDLEKVEIELNKKQDGSEFLDLNWSSNETIKFIPTVKITENILLNLPAVSGVAFVKKSYFKMGIVIAHEGYLIDQTDLIHASSEYNRTVNVDFLSYLFNDGDPRFDGIMFYKINPI